MVYLGQMHSGVCYSFTAHCNLVEPRNAPSGYNFVFWVVWNLSCLLCEQFCI